MMTVCVVQLMMGGQTAFVPPPADEADIELGIAIGGSGYVAPAGNAVHFRFTDPS